MVGVDQRDSYVGDESKNNRGVSKLKYLVQHGLGRRQERSR